MARVLIVESDPMLTAAVEDRLHLAGHQVSHLDAPDELVAKALELSIDLLVLSLDFPGMPGLERVRAVRESRGLRALPILAVAEPGGDRVAALKAGVDELLTRPVDPEELLIRADRLLGSSAASPAVMQGDLANHPVWELMQYVQQAGKSGELSVRGSRVGSGRLRAIDGRVLSARFGDLEGRDALLAILDQRSGSFRLVTEEISDRTLLGSDAFPIPEVLMQAAWLEDELAKRAAKLPATGARLRAEIPAGLEIPEDLESVPIPEIAEQIVRNPGTRLYDLFSRSGFAPQKVRVAVAWLVEMAVVSVDAPADGGLMSTTEISSTMVLDVALQGLVSAARKAGFESPTLPYLLLVEPGVREQLEAVLTSVPGFHHIAPLRSLVDRLRLRQGGSATFETGEGKLSLHVQVMSPQVKPQIEAVLSGCAGVLVWLGGVEDRSLISDLVERWGKSAGTAMGVLVAEGGPGASLVSELAASSGRWRATTHPPRSLIGVLRLLHPVSGE